jgi:hypothetical protein
MTLLRLAYARSHLPRRRRLSDTQLAASPKAVFETLSHSTVLACLESLSDALFDVSSELRQAATSAAPFGAEARILAFEAGYILLAAVATGDEQAGFRSPSEELAVRGASLLGLPREDRELAQALASIYRLSGWEALDLSTLFEWVRVVTMFARCTGLATGLPEEALVG